MAEKVNPLCDYPMADTPRRMGRPPLSRESITKVTQVRLTADVMRRIDAIAGPNRMASFIRDAVMRALEEAESATEPMAEQAPVSAGRSRAKPRGSSAA